MPHCTCLFCIFETELSNNIFTSWLRILSKLFVPSYSHGVFYGSALPSQHHVDCWFLKQKGENRTLGCSCRRAYEELAGTGGTAVTGQPWKTEASPDFHQSIHKGLPNRASLIGTNWFPSAGHVSLKGIFMLLFKKHLYLVLLRKR